MTEVWMLRSSHGDQREEKFVRPSLSPRHETVMPRLVSAVVVLVVLWRSEIIHKSSRAFMGPTAASVLVDEAGGSGHHFLLRQVTPLSVIQTKEKISSHEKRRKHADREYVAHNFRSPSIYQYEDDMGERQEEQENDFADQLTQDQDEEFVPSEQDDSSQPSHTGTTTYPCIHYLGIGYDVVFGNPLGDPVLMVDPGFRDPVVQLTWSTDLDSGGVTNDLRTLQPLQGFVRPEMACKEQQKAEDVANLDDYTKNLSVDASVSASIPGTFSFSASAGYRNFAKTVSDKKSKTFILKVYCLQYVAGLSEALPWKHTAAFATALDGLPNTFNKGDKCSWEKYRTDPQSEGCGTNVAAWVHFFKEFGTHTVKLVHLGGKITHQITANSSDITKLQEKGLDVQTALKATVGIGSGGASSSVSKQENEKRQTQTLKTDIQTTVIGGEPPEDIKDKSLMAKWSKSVKKFPMPIRVDLVPLDFEMESEKQKKAYKKAFIFYSKAFGYTEQDVETIKGRIVPLSQQVQILGKICQTKCPVTLLFVVQLFDATSVFYAGKPGGYAACPANNVVLAGFGLHMNFLKHYYGLQAYHMVQCTPGQ
eukprot:GHVQ01014818.1.p1 GENE.GHVQ01014818.1~~GHVQ01014818.1.p1  ORF type:complete len:592 (+),score=60.43 GHVQ01014818.1:170-1945(+)